MPLPHYPGNYNYQSTLINSKFINRKKKIERILLILSINKNDLKV